jgi:hypothetical protein
MISCNANRSYNQEPNLNISLYRLWPHIIFETLGIDGNAEQSTGDIVSLTRRETRGNLKMRNFGLLKK